MKDKIRKIISESVSVKNTILENEAILNTVDEVASLMVGA